VDPSLSLSLSLSLSFLANDSFVDLGSMKSVRSLWKTELENSSDETPGCHTVRTVINIRFRRAAKEWSGRTRRRGH